jgi:hypothetical protein
MRVLCALAATALVAIGVAGEAMATPPDYLVSSQSPLTGTTIALKDGSRPQLLDRVLVHGRIPVPGPYQRVTVTVRREGRQILSRSLHTNPLTGRYRMPLELRGCCSFTAQAAHGTDISSPYAFQVRAPRVLEPGRETLLFNRLLQKRGYHMGDVSDELDYSSELAILAMRKTLDLPRTEEYDPSLFAALLKGEGGFEPVHREHDRHVEVDLSRQVMALVENGKATDVFHVSSGAFGTPTGTFHFYSRGPGYNAKGMYYSVYYDGNYATHGYASVPTYPASHGCVRNPEVYSVFIYDWIDLGDTMYVYE